MQRPVVPLTEDALKLLMIQMGQVGLDFLPGPRWGDAAYSWYS
jgi:hypothetical protein